MLTIRPAQMQIFNRKALEPFEDEMVRHSQAITPRICEVVGEKQLRVALGQTIDRALGHGFTLGGPLRLFIEMMFLFGHAFDTDPQYPWAAEILGSPAEQTQRAQKLWQKVVHYQKKVVGERAANVRQALDEVLVLSKKPFPVFPGDYDAGARREMQRVFPQKAAYLGERSLTELIEETKLAARKHHFTPSHGQTALLVLMFVFGHGCIDDPLYPWIGRTLEDEKISDPGARAARLEKKSVTWLEHVLAGPSSGETIA